MSKKKQSSEPSQIASSSANTKTSGSNEVDRQLAQQPSRTEPSEIASSPASTATALPSLRNTVHVWIDGSCLNQGSKAKETQGRAGGALPSIQISRFVLFLAHKPTIVQRPWRV